MKKFFFLFLIIILTSCSEDVKKIKEVKEVSADQLVEREDLWYEKFSDIPYTGNQIDYHENGQLKGKGQYVDGKPEGLFVWYGANGNLEYKYTFKDGIII